MMCFDHNIITCVHLVLCQSEYMTSLRQVNRKSASELAAVAAA